MTEFRPLSPTKAIELLKAAGVENAQRKLRNYAAAGLVKSYALVVDTIRPGGAKQSVRGGALATDLWDRIIADGVEDDVWADGTVRLPAGEMIGGKPAVNITDIGFNPTDLARAIDRHVRDIGNPDAGHAATPPIAPAGGAQLDAPAPSTPPSAGPTAIPDGAVTVTIRQAMSALGLGRTTIDKLCGEGRLTRMRVGGRALITTDSIRELVGLQVSDRAQS